MSCATCVDSWSPAPCACSVPPELAYDDGEGPPPWSGAWSESDALAPPRRVTPLHGTPVVPRAPRLPTGCGEAGSGP